MNSVQIENSISAVDGNYTKLRGLIAAVVAQAISDVRRGPKHYYHKNALLWLLSDRTDYAFSFLNICEFLDINPHNARRKLGLSDKVAA